MSTNGLPPAGGLPQNQPFHPQSQKMPMQQPWNGGSAGSSGKTISTYLELANARCVVVHHRAFVHMKC